MSTYHTLSRNTERTSRYYNDPEQTALAMQADEDGVVWMRSGDEGIMDEEGYLRSEAKCHLRRSLQHPLTLTFPVVGRIKDIIIRGGEVSSEKSLVVGLSMLSALHRTSSRYRSRTY